MYTKVEPHRAPGIGSDPRCLSSGVLLSPPRGFSQPHSPPLPPGQGMTLGAPIAEALGAEARRRCLQHCQDTAQPTGKAPAPPLSTTLHAWGLGHAALHRVPPTALGPGQLAQPQGRAGAHPITAHAGNEPRAEPAPSSGENQECCSDPLPYAPSRCWGMQGSIRPRPPTRAHSRSRVSKRAGNKEKRGGEKKKVGPVSQLWPFVPRAFGPSSKGIGFAEANDDTSTSSGAGSACCWRRATGVKKYCGHLIIDSLFLHYDRAQRPQLRLRPLCTHHTHTHTHKGSSPCPTEEGQPGPSPMVSSWQSPRMLLGKEARMHPLPPFPNPTPVRAARTRV